MYDEDENDPGDEVIPWNKFYSVTNDINELYPIEIEIIETLEVNTDVS